jgi:dTDP-4-dehydrorhamnose reductase
MRILVTGAAGRLGAAVSTSLTSAGHEIIALTRADLEITSAERVNTLFNQLSPHVIINCAGYNAVDAAELSPATAFASNATGPALLAQAAEQHQAVLVHYSTDFVFDGTTDGPYSEGDSTNPLNIYGQSKLLGEQKAGTTSRHYILRVESLFGGRGVKGHRATVDLIADTLLCGGRVSALIDRTVTPSYVPDIVKATRALIETRAPYGTYHCVNSGTTTWYGLAHEVAATLAVAPRIDPVTVSELTSVARRPRFCALSNQKLQAVGIALPAWQTAIRHHLSARGVRVAEQTVT